MSELTEKYVQQATERFMFEPWLPVVQSTGADTGVPTISDACNEVVAGLAQEDSLSLLAEFAAEPDAIDFRDIDLIFTKDKMTAAEAMGALLTHFLAERVRAVPEAAEHERKLLIQHESQFYPETD